MAIEAASDGASDSESDDFLPYAEVRQKLRDGSKLVEEALLDRINLLSFKTGDRPRADEVEMRANIRLTARRLDELKIGLWKALSGIEDAVTELHDDVLSVHVAGLFNDFTGSPGFGREFDLPALGIIPGLPSRDEESFADDDQFARVPAMNRDDSDSIDPAVADDRSSMSIADTLFDDLYDESGEKATPQYTPAADNSGEVGGGEQPDIDSEDDTVVEDTYQPVRFGSSESTASGSQAQDDIIIPGLR